MCVCVFEGTAMWMDQHRSSKSTSNLVTSWNYIKRWLAISTNLKPINIIICTTISAHRLTQPCSGWHSRFNLNWQIVEHYWSIVANILYLNIIVSLFGYSRRDPFTNTLLEPEIAFEPSSSKARAINGIAVERSKVYKCSAFHFNILLIYDTNTLSKWTSMKK